MVFKDNYMWRKKKNKPFDYGAKINRFFKEVQKVNAVYEDKEFIRLFDGFLFWKYKGTQLKRGVLMEFMLDILDFKTMKLMLQFI